LAAVEFVRDGEEHVARSRQVFQTADFVDERDMSPFLRKTRLFNSTTGPMRHSSDTAQNQLGGNYGGRIAVTALD
jgi:hypothetical protein